MNWIDSQGCDAETLVEISHEMSDIISEDFISFEDSRCFYRLCIDMTKDFQTKYINKNWEIDDFLSELICYTKLVKNKLQLFPNWINTDYKWMYGKDSVSDLLLKSLPCKYID